MLGISSASGRSKHLSVSSVDFDVEGGGRLDEKYDTGLPWPLASSSQPLSWSAKGPAAQIPRLSLAQSAKAHLAWSRAGWSDGNRWPEAIKLITNSADIRKGIIKGLLLSGVISTLVFFFELAFLPTVLFRQPLLAIHDLESVDGDALGSLGNVFWLYPLIGGSYLLASSWTTDVAEAAYRLRHGHVKNALSMASLTPPAGTSRRLVRESYRGFLIVNYAILVLLLGRIPYVGRTLSFLFMSFIDGYYCFEQVWIARGWSLERRTRYCEERWSYFIAFGLPSTAISFFHPSGLLNLMLFMLVFPFCTVLAMLASPQPRISASGSSSTFSPTPGAGSSDLSYTSGPLSVLLPGRIPVFWPTIKLHRLIMRAVPNLAEVPQSATDKAFERSTAYAYGRAAHGGGSPMPAGVMPSGGRTAAQLVGGIWSAGGTARSASGSPNPSAWASPQLGGEAGAWSNAPQPYDASFASSTTGQTQHLHSRMGGPLSPSKAQNGATPYVQNGTLPPPPKGKARGGARKTD